MAKFVVINNACDGRHVSMFSTVEKARKKVRDLVGGHESTPILVGHPYYSDWGNRVLIEERPDGWTVSLESRVDAAFDARECGVATPKQLALLESVYM